ncbi:hypothetical protein F511_31849 [Dorcoceras hygrometricum]|uniref:3'-5' exonuclease domain-containing protein n=1 Tax=Dorcoceras hygrometricum TaxID=472368 RepID=A0A2Z7AJP9_9LAMI|nr:hypothetical protein F511_31849 [Dorcoceras hygrometricum]
MDRRSMQMETPISKHAFFDLSHVSPLVFLYLLKGCYDYGTCKAAVKFRALQKQVHLVLLNNSQAGPATFIARCICIMPIFDSYRDGFSHLIVSALRRFLKLGHYGDDLQKAKLYAAKLFVGFVGGSIVIDEGILIKVVQTFDVNLIDIEKAIPDIHMDKDHKVETGKEVVEKYVFRLIEFQSYLTAVDLLIQFSIREPGDSLLLKMMKYQQFKAAEKWAAFMGKATLCLLVQEYADQKLAHPAYDVIKKYGLRSEFPELYLQGKERQAYLCYSLKKLAEKGVWEIAEARAKGDGHLLEYLVVEVNITCILWYDVTKACSIFGNVYLAMEAGYCEKVEELCARYSLEGFSRSKELEVDVIPRRHLQLHELFIEDVIWVDEVHGLRNATCYFEECKVVGVDCEWKPNYEKGSNPSKVSIMQMASDKKVYIFDLIKLHEDVPTVLDECLSSILQSPSILKLGYNFQCDVKQLAHSYGELTCFKHYDMLLDIQNVFKEPCGGLSGLAEKILGTGLNKTRRNSNWEQRPLNQYQLEYAALDAAVLVHIFRHVGSHTSPAGASDGHAKIEWKSYIVWILENLTLYIFLLCVHACEGVPAPSFDIFNQIIWLICPSTTDLIHFYLYCETK